MEPDRNDMKDAAMNGVASAGMQGQMSAAGWQEYALIVSRAQGYELDEAQLARVVAQLELISGIAAPLLALQLPAELEPAPVFRP
ncbi:DUF4089 domain-containing protein [Uliginosibacterium sp. H3]|uniref:DUF4089 domain-containing protein n=1 Tax=Uliginosibacterium silvisoli TaxID=3114758 RepID=A0ABU6JY85_9RHOO|nr:DUF4089 domain-containing protein [Uliginosibacterium sp. H3]